MKKALMYKTLMYKNIQQDLAVGMYTDVIIQNGQAFACKNNITLGELKTEEQISRIPNRNLKGIIKEIAEDYIEIEVITFADLHRHTGYSLLDGMCKIPDMVKKTEYAGAITDHGVMYGMVEYYQEMKAAGKQPIIGVEVYTTDKEGNKRSYHLVLLAKNQIGYKNLLKIVSNAYNEFYKKPHVTYDELIKHKDGLIVLSACLGGEIPRSLLSKDYEKAKSIAKGFKDIFGEDYYIEIQRHDLPEEAIVNPQLIKLAKELDIKLVATTDSHFVNPEDSYAHEVLCCIQTQKTMADSNRFKMEGTGFHIHTPEEIEYKFADIIEAVDNTLEIAEKCAGFEMEFGKISMPQYTVPEGFKTLDEYLVHLAEEGFSARFKGTSKFNDPVYRERLKYELDTICSMGFPGYFIIVWDFIKYAKDNGIAVGPGRGSAVGCLVAYCLNITDLDPIKYNLFFERFLNPERVSMPDVDIDFEYERRQEVIDYVTRKYGQEAVSKIVTFGTMAAKRAVLDVAKALGYETWMGSKVAGMIPNELKMTISKALKTNPELADAVEKDADIAKIIDIAQQLEGLQRHSSQHACGVLIAPGPVSDYLPTAMVTNEDTNIKELTSQVNMVESEMLGLLKMDFLGLRTMGVLNNLKMRTGEDYATVPIDDPYVYQTIAKGTTQGVFQLESAGMRNFMTQLFSDVNTRIKCLEDKYQLKGFGKRIQGNGTDKEGFQKEMSSLGSEFFERTIAGVSLYRPGPMDYIPNYIKGLQSPKQIEYLHPLLEPILKDTYGTIVYQEQVMKIVQELAGYSLGRSDLIRRAMGKKKIDVMNKEKENFIHGLPEEGVKGCVANGVAIEVAETIWEQMVDFAKYAFNKSHAAAYACIAVRCTYYKHYYKEEFMCQVLNSVVDKSDKLKEYLNATKKEQIRVVAPSVQNSVAGFSVQDGKIVYGFKGLKKINQTASLIEEVRKEGGQFKDLSDFLRRLTKTGKTNIGFFEALVFTGALDCFEGTKASKLDLSNKVYNAEIKAAKTNIAGQFDLFSMSFGEIQPELLSYEMKQIKEYPRTQLLEKELEYAGLYVSGHPANGYRTIFDQMNATCIEDIPDRAPKMVLGGMITEVKRIYTKKNDLMFSLNIEDETGSIRGIVFPTQAAQLNGAFSEKDIVAIQGEIQENDFGKQIIVQHMVVVGNLDGEIQPKEIRILGFEDHETETLLSIVNEHPGKVPVVCVNKFKQSYKLDNTIKFSEDTIEALRRSFGKRLKVKYL